MLEPRHECCDVVTQSRRTHPLSERCSVEILEHSNGDYDSVERLFGYRGPGKGRPVAGDRKVRICDGDVIDSGRLHLEDL